MIDDRSPPGSWRAALAQNAVCAVCRQQVCEHSDVEYQGLVPVPDGAAIVQKRVFASGDPDFLEANGGRRFAVWRGDCP